MARIVIGVDGGGSRVRAVVAEAGAGDARLGSAEGPGAVAERGREARAVGVVEAVVRAAVLDAGVQLPVDALWAGLAGAGREATRAEVEALLTERGLARRVTVGTDLAAAFEAAFPRGPGILLLAGTGSVALARAEDGRVARAGGWGFRLGDEGSGWWLGHQALNAVTRAVDGRAPPTALTRTVLDATGLTEPDELIDWMAAAERVDVAALAGLVGRAAEAGDRAAAGLIDEAVRELVRHAEALHDRLGPWTVGPVVALAGGLLGEGGVLRERVREALGAAGMEVRAGAVDAVGGAVGLAKGLAEGMG